MFSLDQLRKNFSGAFIYLLWFNGVLTSVVLVWRYEGESWLVAIASLGLAIGSTLIWRADPIGEATRIVTSAASAAQVALLVYAFAGHTYQTDMHMYFFAVLAVSAGWVDPRAIIANAAVVALHHIVLNFALPYAVFPTATSDIARLLIHAVILIVQACVLVWLSLNLQKAFNSAEGSMHSAEDAARVNAGRSDENRQRAEEESRQRAQLVGTLDSFQQEISGLLDGVRLETDEMAQASTALASVSAISTREAEAAEQSVRESSAAIRSVASATEEMSSSVSELHVQITGVQNIIGLVQHAAEAAQADVAQLMDEAARISDVVNIIQNIAGQTNLLALNATIEAARAGEMGKGFAVVAGEVKMLAHQTAKATGDISERITAITNSTRSTVDAMESIARKIGDATLCTTSIVASIDQQRAATTEIASNTSYVAQMTQRVSDASIHSKEAVCSTGASINAMSASLASVQSATNRLARTIDAFVQRLAA